MYKDADGEFWHILAGAVVGAVVGAVSSIVSQVVSGEEINWTAVAIEAGAGAVSGAINAACPCLGPVATGFVEGTISAVSYAATEKFAYGRDPSFGEVLSVGISSGVMAGSMKYVSQELGLVQCFVSGTIVSTASCTKNIEDIQVGDKVWATNPETGETALKEVTQLFRGQTDEWVHVFAGEEEIVCTPGHPFYLPEKGWINAGDLRVGDMLVTLEGSSIIIERIYREQLETPETTYNFEVEDFHTYYVGDQEFLVHNKCDKLKTNKEASEAAESLGYKKVHGESHGKAIFKNPKASRELRYITPDVDSHSGGIWKAAEKIDDLFSKNRRSGTYNLDLTIRIGD